MASTRACYRLLNSSTVTGYVIRPYIVAARTELPCQSVRTAIRKGFATATPTALPRQNARRLRTAPTSSDISLSDSPTGAGLDFASASIGEVVLERQQEAQSGGLHDVDDLAASVSSEPPKASEDHRDLERPSEAEIEDQPSSTSTPNSNLPWYLQVNPPTPVDAHPLSARHQLPPLPEHPPPLLASFLSHISIDIGMDDLSLLDLRDLDPPAALGANLIMIIGTARSEKHLHVSADRLCRWLRSEHKLSPFADGLLGRNELKLKLRRKAKRSKLMSAIGAQQTGQVATLDDGIRTGWVCVNVGSIDGGVLPAEETEDGLVEQDFVGFRDEVRGTKIVVQLMTEERRGQLDLETLWSGILRRSKRNAAEQHLDVDAIHGPRDALSEVYTVR